MYTDESRRNVTQRALTVHVGLGGPSPSQTVTVPHGVSSCHHFMGILVMTTASRRAQWHTSFCVTTDVDRTGDFRCCSAVNNRSTGNPKRGVAVTDSKKPLAARMSRTFNCFLMQHDVVISAARTSNHKNSNQRTNYSEIGCSGAFDSSVNWLRASMHVRSGAAPQSSLIRNNNSKTTRETFAHR